MVKKPNVITMRVLIGSSLSIIHLSKQIGFRLHTVMLQSLSKRKLSRALRGSRHPNLPYLSIRLEFNQHQCRPSRPYYLGEEKHNFLASKSMPNSPNKFQNQGCSKKRSFIRPNDRPPCQGGPIDSVNRLCRWRDRRIVVIASKWSPPVGIIKA